MKKLLKVILIVVLVVACLWISLNYLIWFLPSQPGTRDIALADLDGDGDLDAFLSNGRNEGAEPNTVLLNDGKGNFQNSGQKLGSFESIAVILQDFDSDGDMDALFSNISWGVYFWNSGDGQFKHSRSINFPNTDGYYTGIWRFKAADLNGDNRIDLFLNGCCGGGVSTGADDWRTINAYNTIWLSTGDGLLKYTGQKFGRGSSGAVALGDLDGDSDLDAFSANTIYLDEFGEPVDYDSNQVWLNDGNGVFSDSGQKLGKQRSYSVALGDLDGDGDLDALVGNLGPDEAWLNDGQAEFTQGYRLSGNTLTRYLYLTDLDGDGDLDAFTGDDRNGRIWLNNGMGDFKDSGQKLIYTYNHAVALGDVDGNGKMDVVAGKLDSVKVWFNDGSGRMRNSIFPTRQRE